LVSSIDAFLRYFRGVHQRTARDVALLPWESAEWRPQAAPGVPAWNINRIVEHIAVSRLMFVGVYCGHGWIIPTEPATAGADDWQPALEASYATLHAHLRETTDGWLTQRVGLLDEPGDIAGWRVLMLMVEHEIHHRSQLATYAGLNGWPVADLFGRSYEQIQTLQRAGGPATS
jgi:uncharacterized damage-inducible protein DinB